MVNNTIPKETQEEIQRLHKEEGYGFYTIANMVGVSRPTAKKYATKKTFIGGSKPR